MKIFMISTEEQKDELIAAGPADLTGVEWTKTLPSAGEGDACIDLLFTPDPVRIDQLKRLRPALVLVNAVEDTTGELPEDFVRFNGWPGFLKRSIVEAACRNPGLKPATEKVFAFFHKSVEWTPDIPGFISARVISMIINEAYFALQEEVSSKEEIDIAMKLGTNYPFGPFEWSRIIGLERVRALLLKMAAVNPRYEPAALLTKEAVIS